MGCPNRNQKRLLATEKDKSLKGDISTFRGSYIRRLKRLLYTSQTCPNLLSKESPIRSLERPNPRTSIHSVRTLFRYPKGSPSCSKERIGQCGHLRAILGVYLEDSMIDWRRLRQGGFAGRYNYCLRLTNPYIRPEYALKEHRDNNSKKEYSAWRNKAALKLFQEDSEAI